MAEGKEKVSFEVEATGTLNAGRQFKSFADAVRDSGKAQAFAAKSGKQLDDQFKTTAGRAGAFAGVMGNLGTAIGGTNQQLNAMLGVVGTAGSSISALSGILGGVGGVLGGGVIAAIGLFAVGIRDAVKETENLAKATVTLNETLDDNIKLIRQASAAHSRQQQLAMGVAGEEVTGAKLMQLENQAQRVRARAAGAFGNVDAREAKRLDAERRRLEAEISKTRADFFRQQQESQQFAQEDFDLEIEEGRKKSGTPKAKMGDAFAREQAVEAQIAAIDQMQADARARQRSEEMADFDRRQKMRSQEIDEERKKQEEIAAAARERRDAEIKAEDEAADLAKARREAITQSFSALASAGASATASQLSALAKGQKASLGVILESIGDQAVAEGTRALFSAAILSFTPGGQAAAGGMAAAGAAEIAFGMGLGAVGAGGGAGGAGGSASARQFSATGGTTRVKAMEPMRSGNSYRAADGTTIVHVEAKMLEPSAEAGAAIVKSMDKAKRHGLA